MGLGDVWHPLPQYVCLLGPACCYGGLRFSCFEIMSARVLASRALLFVLGCLSLVFIHPNSIFVGVVFLLPFTVSRIISFGFSLRTKVIASVSFVAFVFFCLERLILFGHVPWCSFV